MKKISFTIGILLFCVLCSFAQNSILFPYFEDTDTPDFVVDSIFVSDNESKIFCSYTNNDSDWANISKEMYIKNNDSGDIFNILDVEGLPFSPDKRYFTKEETIQVTLVFPNIGYCKSIDIIEYENEDAFNIYEIDLSGKNQRLTKDEHKKRSETLFSEGVSLYNQEHYEEAIDKFKECSRHDKHCQYNHIYIKYNDDWIGSSYYKLGQEDNAKKYSHYYKSHPIDRRNTIISDSLMFNAFKFQDENNKEKYLEFLLKTYDAQKKELGANHPLRAVIIDDIAYEYEGTDSFDLAYKYYEESFKMRLNNMDKDDYFIGLSYVKMANCLYEIDQDSLALDYYDKGFEILKKNNQYECFPVATGLDRIGMLYLNRENYDKAITYELESVSMLKSLGGNKNPYYKAAIAKEYNTIMVCSSIKQNWGDALKYGNRAIEIRKELFGTQHPLYINTAMTLSGCYRAAGKYEKAYEIDSLCLASFKPEKISNNNYHISNQIYYNLISTVIHDLSKLERYEDEEKHLGGAVNEAEKYDSLLHVEFASKLADCYRNQHKYDHAMAAYKYCANYYANLNMTDSLQSSFIKYISCFSLADKVDELTDYLVKSRIWIDDNFNKNNTDNLLALYDKVIDIFENNNESKATIGLYNKKIELLKSRKTNTLHEKIENLNDIAICFYNLGKNKKAIPYLYKALSLCDHDSSLEQDKAELCAQLAMFYGSEELDSASVYTKKAIDIASKLEGYELWCFEMLATICRYCVQNEKYDEGEYFGLKAVDMPVAQLPESKLNFINELFVNLYSVYLKKGNIQKQFSILKRYFEISDLNVDDYYLFLLSSLAYAYQDYGMTDGNILTLERYIDVYREYHGEKDKKIYKPMIRLAKALYSSARYSKAISVGSTAMEIINSSANLYSDDYVEAILDMAGYYSSIGNIYKSKELYEKAKLILEETFDVETANGHQCGQMSQIYEHLGDTQDAIKYMTLAIERFNQVGDKVSSLLSISRLGVMLSYSGNFDEAYKIYSDLLEQENTIYTKDSEEYAYRLLTIAKNFERAGNYQSAENYYLQALKTNDKAFNKSANLANAINEELATLYYKIGNYDNSYKYLKKCIYYSRDQISADFLNLEKHDKENLWNQNKDIFLKELPNLAVNSQREDAIEAMYDNTFLFAKGLISYTESALSYYASLDPEIKTLYDEVVKKKLYRDSQLRLSEYNRITEIEQIDKELRTLHDEIVSICYKKNLSGQFVNVSWKDVKNALTDEDVVIDFFAVADSSYATKGELYIACVLKKSYSSPKLIRLCYESDLENVVNDLYSMYNTVWKLLENEFLGRKKIYFSPWNRLTNLPIEYAVNEEGKVLFDYYKCYRLSSSRELVVRSSEQPIKNVILYGGLKYDTTCDKIQTINESKGYSSNSQETYRGLTDSLMLRSGFDYLPYSLEEVKGIYDLCTTEKTNVSSCKLITGENGTEESFKSLYGQDINLIHIATHGAYIADEQSQYYHKLFHEDDENKYSQIDNSLSRSFVVMSGGDMLCKGVVVPEGMDDGILSAKEISKLDFHGLELAVISTCNSGIGDFSSEGTMGIQQGFKKAGAKSILMTVDYIDDKATNLFMICFYKNLLDGNSKYESLQKALHYLRNYDNGKYSDPKYWTSFILLDAVE